MTQLLTEVWGVIVILWTIGYGSTRRGLNAARWIIRTVLLAILIWPLIVLAVAYYGQLGLTALVATAPIGFFFLLILMYPLVSGILAVVPQGRIVWRYLLLLVFAEVVVGLYLILVPVWNSPQLMGLLTVLVSVLGMFLILKAMFGWRNRWVTGFAGVLTVGVLTVTALFFFVGRAQERIRQGAGVGQRGEVAATEAVSPAAPATLDSVKEITRIPLLGEDVLSEETLLLPGAIPPLWYYYFDGPPDAQVHFGDEAGVTITGPFGRKGGTLRFSGPEGEEVVVYAYPPPKK